MKDKGFLMPNEVDAQKDPLGYAAAWRRTGTLDGSNMGVVVLIEGQ